MHKRNTEASVCNNCSGKGDGIARVLISLQLVSEAFLTLRRIQRGIIINVHRP
jgi:hypothetical protein